MWCGTHKEWVTVLEKTSVGGTFLVRGHKSRIDYHTSNLWLKP